MVRFSRYQHAGGRKYRTGQGLTLQASRFIRDSCETIVDPTEHPPKVWPFRILEGPQRPMKMRRYDGFSLVRPTRECSSVLRTDEFWSLG